MTSPASGDRVRAVEDRRSAAARGGDLVPAVCALAALSARRGHHRRRAGRRGPSHDRADRACSRDRRGPRGQRPDHKDPSWRRIADLAQAAEQGLLEVHDITGGTWEEMLAELDEIVAPLAAAGWQILDRLREESSAHGDSVICSLKRGRTQIDVEYFHDGDLQVWDGAPGEPDGCYPPLFAIKAATPTSASEAFRTQGWLPPPN